MLPEQMHAVQLDDDGRLSLARIPVPRPARGEVLIRTAAAPINPSDLRFLSGSGGSAGRMVPGLEGSGTVVASGGGLLPRFLVGRRVAFASAQGGTWAEYGVAPAMGCIPLRKTVSLEQGASLIVNPLTAVAFFEMAKRGRHTAIINNAAASALGRMIIRLGRRVGVPVINIVRRPHHVNLLDALDAEYVLDSSDARFVSALGELAHRLHATLAFDAVGGEQTQWLTDAMPFGSTIVVYAGLAGEPSVFNPRALAGDNKKIIGFYLRNWMAQRGVLGLWRDVRRVQALTGSDLQTTIRGRFPLSAAQRALESYRADMTAGKVLLVPGASEAMDGRHEPSVA